MRRSFVIVRGLLDGMVHAARLDTTDAARVARDLFGVAGAIEPLTGERDENFRVRAAHGDFVLKVSHPDESPALVAMTVRAMAHVAVRAPAVICPRVTPTLTGTPFGTAGDPGGVARLVRLVDWLPGQPLRHAPRSPAQRIACGRTAAMLAMAMTDFEDPAAGRHLIWDVAHGPVILDLLDELPDVLDAGFMRAFVAGYRAAVGDRFDALPRQVLHNDLNANNVLVGLHDPDRIAAVIDFGDMVETARAADAAIAAAAQTTDADAAPVQIAQFLGAYHALNPLEPAEWAVMNWLVAMRLTMGVVIPSWHRHRNPGDPHYDRITPSFVARNLAIVRRLMDVRFSAEGNSR